MSLKRIMLCFLLCILAPLLCACTSAGIPIAKDKPTLTLPPAAVDLIAPIGDAALEYTVDATLYLPRHDGAHLTAIPSTVIFAPTRPHAESLTRALLAYPGDGVVSALGGQVKLALYGINPVEVSGNVATINLSASALQMDRKQFFIACQAMTNTLTELTDIHYVNVLVADRPVGLDVAGTLPMGTLSRNVEQDIGALYDQLVSRRATAEDGAAAKPFSSNVTLYFPISGTSGMLSEVRACSFQNQLFPDMVTTILRQLGDGPQQALGSPALPLLSDLLSDPPALVDFEKQGGQIATLHFAYNLDAMLETYGLTRAQSMASLCYTLCTYFPNIAGIHVTIGEAPVDTLLLTTDFQSSVIFPENVQKRADFATLLYNQCTLYFADSHGKTVVKTERPISYYQCQNPRTLLVELAKGPQSYDSVSNLTPIMPKEAIRDADLLGIALSEHTLVVNFAQPFASIGKGMDAQAERLFTYAMVNTLCSNERIKSVCFFLSGKQFDGFSGEIYWRGLFYPML
ncbi:MAG: GerMN domain-containing protein [Clostridia bacterium]